MCVCVCVHAHALYITNPDATDLVEEVYPLIGNILGQPETRMGIVKGVSTILKNKLDGVNKIM